MNPSTQNPSSHDLVSTVQSRSPDPNPPYSSHDITPPADPSSHDLVSTVQSRSADPAPDTPTDKEWPYLAPELLTEDITPTSVNLQEHLLDLELIFAPD